MKGKSSLILVISALRSKVFVKLLHVLDFLPILFYLAVYSTLFCNIGGVSIYLCSTILGFQQENY